MGYTRTEHQKAIVKLVRDFRMILQAELAKRLNKKDIKHTVEKLVEQGKIKRQKVKVRGKVGNLTDQYLLYSNDVKQAEILDYEKELINRPFESPLKKNHCYKKVESLVEQELKPEIIIPKQQESEIIIEPANNMQLITNDVIPIYDNNGERIVNARELHTFLQAGRDFTTWIKKKITKYGFAEGLDYILTLTQTGERKNVTKHEYYLTMNTAKEIAMVENNDQGKYIRRYFIEIENEYKNQNQLAPTNNIEVLKLIVCEMENQNNRINGLENKLNKMAQVIGA